ncbi:MAG TPA: PEGA domain-containing protein, partial [Candidatus Cloacimonadota bacterium]|nr:PEGA domain-containing protein [Candidatus Cloacimonadota bacterium]
MKNTIWILLLFSLWGLSAAEIVPADGNTASKPGIINVISQPENAEIFIDNQKIGNTPFQFSVPAGSHELSITKKNYQSFTTTIHVDEAGFHEFSDIVLQPKFGLLSVNSEPSNCGVFLDENLIGMTPVVNYQIGNGQYLLKLKSPDYLPLVNNLSVNLGDSLNLFYTLDYAYGELSVTTLPEEDATLFIDDQKVGRTPFHDSKIGIGKHTIKVKKEMWIGTETEVIIRSGESIEKTLTLTSNFAEVTLKAENSKLFIDDQYKGTDSLFIRLTAGQHYFEARNGEYLRDYQQATCIAGEKETLTLNPQPQYASLTVNSAPPATEGAQVCINDSLKGTTPLTSQVFMGRNLVQVSCPGYNSQSMELTLDKDEKKNITLEMELYQGSNLYKADRWSSYKWYGLAGAGLCTVAGVFCNMLGDKAFDDYDAATTSADAKTYR